MTVKQIAFAEPLQFVLMTENMGHPYTGLTAYTF